MTNEDIGGHRTGRPQTARGGARPHRRPSEVTDRASGGKERVRRVPDAGSAEGLSDCEDRMKRALPLD